MAHGVAHLLSDHCRRRGHMRLWKPAGGPVLAHPSILGALTRPTSLCRTAGSSEVGMLQFWGLISTTAPVS